MTKAIFDDLLSPPRGLNAFITTQVLGWQGVRWHQAYDADVGKRPGATLETRVPRFTQQEDLVEPVQAALCASVWRTLHEE
ncbi:hypothetical protein NKDENANG_00125 [Candidatus Entotheonellaceae bacterium PAL068K]